MLETFEELKALVEQTEEDMQKFDEKENKAAGKRVRKNMMAIKKLAHQLRQDISAQLNAM